MAEGFTSDVGVLSSHVAHLLSQNTRLAALSADDSVHQIEAALTDSVEHSHGPAFTKLLDDDIGSGFDLVRERDGVGRVSA